MNTHPKRNFPAHQTGVTLVELMVAMIIALILLVIVSSIYLSSRSTYKLNDQNARLQQSGHFALAAMGRHIKQANYGRPVLLKGGRLLTEMNADESRKLVGIAVCDHGFVAPMAAAPDFTCDTKGMPAFQVTYQAVSDVRNPVIDSNTGAGTDCNGQGIDSPVNAAVTNFPVNNFLQTKGFAVNSFFVSARPDGTNTLYCLGNGGPLAQPLLTNVVDLQLIYGVDSRPDRPHDEEDVLYRNAAGTADRVAKTAQGAQGVLAIADGTTPGEQFGKIVSLTVCIEFTSPDVVMGTKQTYIDCSGNTKTTTDQRLHLVLNSTFNLRNNSATSQLYYTSDV